jgi:serine/threonine-protein kinase
VSRRVETARRVGRYLLLEPFASGGMATIHFGGQLGPPGIAPRLVAIKRLHPHLADDPAFAGMFLDEARLAMRVRHPSVVPVLEVLAVHGELFLILELVRGLPLSRWSSARGEPARPLPRRISSAIVQDVLLGLHAAHGARSESGEPLDLVHRDVSPQNVLVGADGAGRIIDFGVAKARGRSTTTGTPASRARSRTWRPSSSRAAGCRPGAMSIRRRSCSGSV